MQRVLTDAIKLSVDMGFRSVVFGGSLKHLPSYYVKLVSSWLFADVFVTIYPWLLRNWISNDNPLREWDDFLIGLLHGLKRKNRMILFLYDLPIDQAILSGEGEGYDEKSYKLEGKILHCFDVLCVYNSSMRELIRDRYDIKDERFVEFECLDYGIKPSTERQRIVRERKWNVFYIGNGDRRYAGDWMNQLMCDDNVRYHFLGQNWDWLSRIERSDITWRFLRTQQDVCDHMHANADFGIVAYADKMNDYFKYECSSKLTAYVTAGVPILVRANCSYNASLVEKYGIGLSFDSFEQIPELVEALSDSEYERMRESCQRLAKRLYTGYFFKRALAESLQRLCVQ